LIEASLGATEAALAQQALAIVCELAEGNYTRPFGVLLLLAVAVLE
jgi:hypothetical protein